MNQRLRQFERESGLSIFGLGAKRHIWEAALAKYAELIVDECAEIADGGWADPGHQIKQHFAVEESKGWVCSKCGVDRTKNVCPQGFGAQVDGRCPMTMEAQ